MKKKVKYLIKNIGLFSLNSFVPKVISFLLVPIYTHYLSTYDYGISDLINTTVFLLIPIFTLDIQDAVLRYSLDSKYDSEEVFSVALKINYRGFIVLVALSFLLYYTNIFQVPNYFFFFLVVQYFLHAIYNSISMFCRGIDKIKNIVIASIINSLVTLLLNILLLVVYNYGIYGYLIANTLGIFCSIIYLFVSLKLHKYIRSNVNTVLLREMKKYSYPLIFSVIAWWINNASDRYILTWLKGVSISGVYSIAYKIPTLLSTFQNVFSQAWSISAIKEFDKNDTDGFVGSMFSLMNFVMCVACSIIMILNFTISKILYSGEFQAAWMYVPPLLLSVVFNAMALFIGGVFIAVKDTRTLSISTIVGAIINTLLNFILIYYFSAYGAAISTLIGYFVVYYIRIKKMKKHINLRINMLSNYYIYILLIIQMIFAYYGDKYIIMQLVILLVIIIVYRKYCIKSINLIKKKIGKYIN